MSLPDQDSDRVVQELFDKEVHAIYSVYPSLAPEQTFLNHHWKTLRERLPQVLALERKYRLSRILRPDKLQPNKEFARILCNAAWFLFEQTDLKGVAELLPTLRKVTLDTRAGNEFFVAQWYRLNMAMYLDTQDYKPALGCALDMLETLKSFEEHDPFLAADGYNAVGLCMLGVGDYDGAKENLSKCIALHEKSPIRNPGMAGIAYANIALMWNLKGDFGQAFITGQQGLELVEEHLGQHTFKEAE